MFCTIRENIFQLSKFYIYPYFDKNVSSFFWIKVMSWLWCDNMWRNHSTWLKALVIKTMHTVYTNTEIYHFIKRKKIIVYNLFRATVNPDPANTENLWLVFATSIEHIRAVWPGSILLAGQLQVLILISLKWYWKLSKM